ncbi:MAG TPA: two-component regulator propeller domain-containing protein [Ferruginibacter sp.]|nr:two-component regulator propeller domain-containing protein [Ferruginibacter sp.]
MRYFFTLLFLLFNLVSGAQFIHGFAFSHITTDDGIGLASNVVRCIFQDNKGYYWVGTANGLQRFDGSKFVSFSVSKPGSDKLPHAEITQIIEVGKGKLILAIPSLREFGLFDPFDFSYHRIPVKSNAFLPVRSEFFLWKATNGEVYMNIPKYGILRFDAKQTAFIDDNYFQFPKGWVPALSGVHEDVVKAQYWICTDSGLCVFDKRSGQIWNRHNNPLNFPILNNEKVQDGITEIYIDQKRRFWAVGWPKWKNDGQAKYCLDSTGTFFLEKDSAGLNTGPAGYTESRQYFETGKGDIWLYGLGILFSYDRVQQRFVYNKSSASGDVYSINYEVVFQMMEDRDGSIWIATDRGLYTIASNENASSVTNIVFDNKKNTTSITDILELSNGQYWFASWGEGVRIVDKDFRVIENDIYKDAPPANWTVNKKNASKLTWNLCRERATGNVWIGCNDGILLIHDPVTKRTRYLEPEACNRSTIRFMVEDKAGLVWLGTQGGRLIRHKQGEFKVMQDIGTIIYKIFIDRQGWIWLATHEKGLYAINPANGAILQHYTAESKTGRLYNNTGNDIEQLNDSLIVYGAGVLNVINKRSGQVRLLTYEDGLPSNNVMRLRMDHIGYLWIVTANGLCRYNPGNNRFTPYGRKDGILLAEQTNVADYASSNGQILFAGGHAVISFDPAVFSNNHPPPDVSITDFKIFNTYIPVDSILELPQVKLPHDQNSFSIYFSSLSFLQRDKLTYYYMMEGVDKGWRRADRGFSENYSLLPPGKYTFKVYCENLEGIRSLHTTSLSIYIRPPFWRTAWFISCMLFILALIIYQFHSSRVKRLLAVEKLRNKVARDLHDDMGSTLSTINILTSMAKTKMNSDIVKTTEYLGKISDNSQRMMEAMDDIVWSIKPSNDSMQKIAARMREFATNVLEAKEIELDFKVEDKVYDEKLDMEARRDFFLVFKEVINNAAKYSRASRVSVNVTVQKNWLILLIRDNGIGFDVATNDNGNGLGNMKKRAEAMRGTIQFISKPGQGTEVQVKVPVM